MSDNPNTTAETTEEELEALMPEGWTGSDDADFFDPSTWGLDDTAPDAAEDGEDLDEGNFEEVSDDRTRTTEEDTEAEAESAENESPTTTQTSKAGNKLRFRADIDHVPTDVELDMADLPAIYQKAQVLDRYQRRANDQDAELRRWDALAAGLQFESREALLQGLMDNAIQDYIAEHPSLPEDMARDYVMRKFQGAAPTTTGAREQATEAAPTRDVKAEVAELFRAFPNARNEKIPNDVTTEAIEKGIPLVQAYANWKTRSVSAEAAEATRVKRENKILKQNQAAAARAPVTKTTGGGKTDTKPVDDFLRGFEDDAAW